MLPASANANKNVFPILPFTKDLVKSMAALQQLVRAKYMHVMLMHVFVCMSVCLLYSRFLCWIHLLQVCSNVWPSHWDSSTSNLSRLKYNGLPRLQSTLIIKKQNKWQHNNYMKDTLMLSGSPNITPLLKKYTSSTKVYSRK